jgi:uridine kinase
MEIDNHLSCLQNADSDVMLSRRILRDVKERGRDVEGIITQYLRFVKRSYDTFVLPSSKHADIIVPGQDNDTAKVLLAAHVQREIDARSLRFRSKLSHNSGVEDGFLPGEKRNSGREVQEPFFTLIKQTNQLQASLIILCVSRDFAKRT